MRSQSRTWLKRLHTHILISTSILYMIIYVSYKKMEAFSFSQSTLFFLSFHQNHHIKNHFTTLLAFLACTSKLFQPLSITQFKLLSHFKAFVIVAPHFLALISICFCNKLHGLKMKISHNSGSLNSEIRVSTWSHFGRGSLFFVYRWLPICCILIWHREVAVGRRRKKREREKNKLEDTT